MSELTHDPSQPLVGEAAKAGKPVRVMAVGAFAGSGRWSGPERVAIIQRAMSDAVLAASADGYSVSNPEHAATIKAYMMAARDQVVAALNASDAEESRKQSVKN